MRVNRTTCFGFPSSFALAGVGQQRPENFLTQNQTTRHCPQAITSCLIATRMSDQTNQPFTPQFLQFIRTGKEITFFCKRNIFFSCLSSYVFMAVEHNLSIEGRMWTQFDSYMSPVIIDNVKRIMIDVWLRLFLADINTTVAVMSHIPHRTGSPSNQDIGKTAKSCIFGKILLGNFMFTLTTLTMNKWDSILISISANPAGKSSGKTYQMHIVKILIPTAGQPAPLCAETAIGLGHDEIGIENNAINTIIRAVQKILIICAEIVKSFHITSPWIQSYYLFTICCWPKCDKSPFLGQRPSFVCAYQVFAKKDRDRITELVYRYNCPEGATSSERSLGRGVVSYK